MLIVPWAVEGTRQERWTLWSRPDAEDWCSCWSERTSRPLPAGLPASTSWNWWATGPGRKTESGFARPKSTDASPWTRPTPFAVAKHRWTNEWLGTYSVVVRRNVAEIRLDLVLECRQLVQTSVTKLLQNGKQQGIVVGEDEQVDGLQVVTAQLQVAKRIADSCHSMRIHDEHLPTLVRVLAVDESLRQCTRLEFVLVQWNVRGLHRLNGGRAKHQFGIDLSWRQWLSKQWLSVCINGLTMLDPAKTTLESANSTAKNLLEARFTIRFNCTTWLFQLSASRFVSIRCWMLKTHLRLRVAVQNARIGRRWSLAGCAAKCRRWCRPWACETRDRMTCLKHTNRTLHLTTLYRSSSQQSTPLDDARWKTVLAGWRAVLDVPASSSRRRIVCSPIDIYRLWGRRRRLTTSEIGCLVVGAKHMNEWLIRRTYETLALRVARRVQHRDENDLFRIAGVSSKPVVLDSSRHSLQVHKSDAVVEGLRPVEHVRSVACSATGRWIEPDFPSSRPKHREWR